MGCNCARRSDRLHLGVRKNSSKRRPLILKFGLDEVVGGVPGLFGGVGGCVGVLPALLLTLGGATAVFALKLLMFMLMFVKNWNWPATLKKGSYGDRHANGKAFAFGSW